MDCTISNSIFINNLFLTILPRYKMKTFRMFDSFKQIPRLIYESASPLSILETHSTNNQKNFFLYSL